MDLREVLGFFMPLTVIDTVKLPNMPDLPISTAREPVKEQGRCVIFLR